MTESPYPSFSVLIVDDEPAWLRSLSISLERSAGITNICQCQDSRLVIDVLSREEVGLILLDLTMPHVTGETLLTMIKEQHPETAIMVITGMNQVETAVRCMKLGAFDYFVKTTEEDRLVSGILRAVRMLELERENRDMKSRFFSDTLEHPEAFAEIITADQSMRTIFRYIESLAGSTQPVLITGESGVGKELIARALHKLSRPDGPLIAVNVAGIDDELFADTLFGHSKGAFTGATDPRNGLIEEARDGTLFLDEIGDLSPVSQVKLLRLVEEAEYFPVGSDRPRRMKARVVLATNQDLKAKQASGGFRKDLYYRLCTHHVHIPPLRDRKEDVPLLLDHFLEEAARRRGTAKPTYPKELPLLLATHGFPGNVRELKSMVYDAMSRHNSRILSMDALRSAIGEKSLSDLMPADKQSGNTNFFCGVERLPTLHEATALLIAEATRRAKGNQTIASRMLGISQPALSKRLKHLRP